MNRQDKWKDGKLISRGIEWTLIFGKNGYTANPVKGCLHGCQWRMPDDTIATCYAKEVAERLATRTYSEGFEHIYYDDSELAAIEVKKEPCGIFIDSMSDLFGQKVARQKILNVASVIYRRPQHIFFSLTKNPSRFREFGECCRVALGRRHGTAGTAECNSAALWPRNWFVGVSSPPTFMYGKELTVQQQRAWFRKALQFLCESPAQVRWVSLEPLSIDVSDILAEFGEKLHWAVIGAASRGAKTFQPDSRILASTLGVLDRFRVPVFFKGNLGPEVLKTFGYPWREEFPVKFRSKVSGLIYDNALAAGDFEVLYP